MRSDRSAFTLVEVLVVVGIVTVLAGLLLPALNGAREHGRRAHCVGNLRQLSLAAVLYASENADRLPPFFVIKPQGIGGGKGAGQSKIDIELNLDLLPTLQRSRGVLRCLSHDPAALVPVANSTERVRISYGYNFFLNYYDVRLSSVQPAEVAIFFDGLPDNDTLGGGWWLEDPHGNKSKNLLAINARVVVPRHARRLNVSFLDGHVEWLARMPATALY